MYAITETGVKYASKSIIGLLLVPLELFEGKVPIKSWSTGRSTARRVVSVWNIFTLEGSFLSGIY